MRRVLKITAFGVLLLFAVEGICTSIVNLQASMKVLPGIREEQHCAYDADLGWSNLPNQALPNLYGPGIGLTTNSQGFRATRDFDAEVPEGRVRIVCLGDSYAMGYGVADDESFAAVIEQRVPEVELINMGLGGYGVDQAYLKYKRDGVAFETDVLLFLVIAEDFYRMQHASFSGRYPKPVLALDGDELAVTNVPVPMEWGREARAVMTLFSLRSGIHKLLRPRWLLGPLKPSLPYKYGELPFRQVAEAVFQELQDLSDAREQAFVVAYLPTQADVATELFEPVVRWLDDWTTDAGIAFVDLSTELDDLTPSEHKTHFLADGHYTVLGNRVIGDALVRELRQQGLLQADGPTD